jgi:hypothetical protein
LHSLLENQLKLDSNEVGRTSLSVMKKLAVLKWRTKLFRTGIDLSGMNAHPND